jgi:serpin B
MRDTHRIRPTVLSTALLGALLAAAGCTDAADPSAPGEILRSDLARDTAPDVPEADRAALREGNTAFALKLHGQLRDEPGNLFYSPHSISTALAMTYAGARGETEAQMAAALSYTLPQDQLHAAKNWLDLELASRGEGAKAADGGGFRLRVTNATFGQTGYGFLADFLDVLALHYGAGMALLDFAAAPDPAREAINDWVDAATEGRIGELLPQGSIADSTRLVLVNAIYFNAAWRDAFEESATADGVFAAPDGDVTVPMMQHESVYGYATDAAYDAVSLRYDGDELDMVIVAPAAGTFDAFEAELDAGALDAIFAALTPAELRLTMPRWETRFRADLVPSLEALGMVDAFSRDADFSGMDGTRELEITGVFHEAFVKVNEAGTEAAAATAVVVGPTSVPDYLPVTIDRPFLFFIRDLDTGAILFIGRIVDPS